jgi:Xaa-Pro aminopeptidase/Xaa-Pro dipeptidase
MSAFSKRRKSLRSLAGGYSNVLAAKSQNLFYLTGFWGGGVGVVLDDRVLLVTTQMETPSAEKSCVETEVVGVPTRADIWKEINRHLEDGTSILDSGRGKKPVKKLTVSEDVFLRARRTKDNEELGRIKSASERIDRIYEFIEREVRVGMTERQVAAEVMRLATLEGLTPFASEGCLSPIIVASAGNGAYPHAELTGRKLKDGDFVVVDLFFRFEGYGSDETRTFGVGKISPEKKRCYQAVLSAQLRGCELANEGIDCSKLHREVVKELERASLSSYFTHGTGHGVGIDVHEMPSVARTSSDVLEGGDVVTVEPGLYFLGRYGIRIEDTLAVGEHPRILTRYTKELVTLG